MSAEKAPLLGHDSYRIQSDGLRARRTVSRVSASGDPHDVRFAGLSLSVSDRKSNSSKVILDNCAGVITTGELTAIIGPSGAGKTSLLNVLAGRTTKGLSKDSRVMLSGRPISEADASGEIAYVTQEDTVYAYSTVRESLMFSAELRLPSSVSKAEKKARVEELIVKLRLQKCADSLVGSALKRGISGGEKKRTSIGIELITDPTILFLDEPTSGLDSFAAMKTIEILKDLSAQGRVVLSTIHQPSSEVFVMFDKCVLMQNGHIMYGGQVDQLPAHFSNLGHPVPAHYNIADHVLYLMQTLEPAQLDKVKATWDSTSQAAIADSLDINGQLRRRREKRRTTGCLSQAFLLFQREVRGTIRNKPALYARYGMSAVLNLIYALIFKAAGQWVDGAGTPKDIQSHFGALTQIVIGVMFGASQPMMLEFPLERPIFIREYGTAHYGAVPYFLSKTLIELPLTLLQVAVIFAVAYFLMDFNGSILYMILIGWGLSVVASSLSLMLGCAISNVKAAMQLSPIVFVPQLLFAGFFIKIEQIPIFLQWAQYLCSLKFAMNLYMLVEFGRPCEIGKLMDGGLNHTTALVVHEECAALLKMNAVHADDWYIYVGVLLGIFVIFRTLAMILLKAKAKGGD